MKGGINVQPKLLNRFIKNFQQMYLLLCIVLCSTTSYYVLLRSVRVVFIH